MRSSRILYLQYTNPAGYPSLGHSSRILAREGWQVLFVGTGAWGGANKLCFESNSNIEVRQIPFCPAGWKQKFHYLFFALWVLSWTLRRRPDWVYASDSFSCPLALLLSYLFGLEIIYHEHDSPATNGKISKGMRFMMLAKRRLARRAKLCVLPNEKRAEHFKTEMANGCRIVSVWNCPAREEISPPRRAREEKSPRLLYQGSIVPSRLPLTVIEALTLLPKAMKLRVIGYETVGHRDYVNTLRNKAHQLGLNERIEFIGTLPTRNEVLSCGEKCDVGIALMPKNSQEFNEQTMARASNKPFDFLACGLALLVSDLSDWKKTFVEPGYGLACDPDDPQSIAAALQWFFDHPEEMRAMGERGRRRILTEWNYEKQFLPVLNTLNGK